MLVLLQLTIIQVLALLYTAHQQGPVLSCDAKNMCHCEQSENGIIAHCSGIGLTDVPQFYSNVTVIDLSKNKISRFKGVGKYPQNIISLSLSDNILQTFNNNSFEGMDSLVYLDLSGNMLRYLPEVFFVDIFKDLKSLKTLNIKRNHNSIRIKYYPIALTRLISLKELRMDGVEDALFDSNFSNLVSLNSVDLSGNEVIGRNCSIRLVDRNYFKHLQQIMHLDLSWCKLHIIELGSFRNLSMLNSLDLSFNVLLTFHVLKNLTMDLKFTNITVLKLNQLHCPSGIGTMLFADDIEHLRHTSLKEIQLQYNRLQLIEESALTQLPKTLTVLNLSFNDLNAGKYLFTFKSMSNLKCLMLGSTLVSATRITKQISVFANCNDWRGPHRNMKLLKAPTYMSVGIGFSGFLPYNITYIDMSNLNLRSKIEEMHFSKNNLQWLDASGNEFHNWWGPVRNLTRLKHLDLSSNNCCDMKKEFFYHFPSLQTLNISSNFIGRFISEDEEGEIFQRQGELIHLDISNTGLNVLPRNVFNTLSKIKKLLVASNTLTEWRAVIKHMTQLQYLDLSDNRMIYLNEDTRKAIDIISKQSNLSINLKGNSLQCTCDTLSSLIWMRNRRSHFNNFSEYSCSFKTNVITFSEIDNVILGLEKTCYNYALVTISALSAVVFSIAVILIGIMYRYRWKIRYLCFLAKKRYKDNGLNRDYRECENDIYEYNAFISYSNDDKEFVENLMLDILETKFGLKMCIHNRDFIPGTQISENITNAIHSSYKTVIVLTRNYLNSDWCNFEFNMARMEGLYSRNGESAFVVVLLECVKSRDIPLTMMAVMETESYIEYPNDEQINDMFWSKLQKSLTQIQH